MVHIGELGLDGSVRPVRGVLPAVLAAAAARRARPWWCRPTTRPRRRWCPGCGCCRRRHLAELVSRYRLLGKGGAPQDEPVVAGVPARRRRRPCPTCATSWGRTRRGWRSRSPRRAGTTCSWSVRRAPARRCWPSGCPDCCRRSSPAQALEVTAIQSLLGVAARGPGRWCPARRSSRRTTARRWPPIIGGGSGFIRPGAISRAHRGVLFLDEAPEFRQSVLQALRQPAESGEVTIARASGVVRFPARFQLVLAANPCPCGRGLRQGGRLLLLADGRGATTWASSSGRCSTGSTCSCRCTPSAGPRWPSRPGEGSRRGGRARAAGPRGPGRAAGRRTVAGQRRGARAGDAPRAVPAAAARRPPTSTGPSSGARSRCAATTGCSSWRGPCATSTAGAHRPGRTWVSRSPCAPGRRWRHDDGAGGRRCPRAPSAGPGGVEPDRRAGRRDGVRGWWRHAGRCRRWPTSPRPRIPGSPGSCPGWSSSTPTGTSRWPRRLGARVVCPEDDEWPTGLDDLDCPPYCLWVRGDVRPGRGVRPVGGGRGRPQRHGVRRDGGDRDGGRARGARLHRRLRRGVRHRRGRAPGSAGPWAVTTLAVLAGGVDRPYPSAHARLIDRIREVGAVVSEVPPGSAPTRSRFLQRNRMIATMTQGTVVVEAGLRSGSLNTARDGGRAPARGGVRARAGDVDDVGRLPRGGARRRSRSW